MKGSPISWIVPAGPRTTRLDAFVRRCLPHLSQREAQRAIADGAFWINDRPGRKGDRIFSGDVLTLKGFPHLLRQSPLPGRHLEVPLLYEDESIVAVDKPAGMATHGFSGREINTLANFLMGIRPGLYHIGRSRWEPGLVHRLDKDTSGIVLAAKDQASFEDLRSQFRRRLIQKKYWVLVWGRARGKGLVAYPLIHDPKDRRKMRAVLEDGGKKNQPRSWQALTRFRTLGGSQGFSLLEVHMDTGVTHQIRVHLGAIGHPLVGDSLYGKGRPDPFGLGRHFLHAFYLAFRHPTSGKDVVIKSPLPRELRRVLERLGIKLRIQ
jgi:23S rRNA pseudouridine1911/1915/1917 synthase